MGFEWPGAYLELLRTRASGQPVWTFDAVHLASVTRIATIVGGACALAPQLRPLRRGGASFDSMFRRRPLPEIKKRGRWRSDASVRRYEKAALARRGAARLSAETQAYAQRVEADLQSFFLGDRPPPAPPLAATRPGR